MLFDKRRGGDQDRITHLAPVRLVVSVQSLGTLKVYYLTRNIQSDCINTSCLIKW